MDDGVDNSRIALKIVLVLSILLVAMDFLEIYFSFLHLKEASLKYEVYIFENCIKYHILSQVVFTLFATFAGLSAFLMSLGLLINYEFFSSKLLETFMFWNYIVFGPYLLTACILGYTNFGKIAFNCDSKDINLRFINFSTLMALVICLLLSIIISMLYAFLYAARKMLLSITFRDGGWKCLGRIFWKHVFSRNIPVFNRSDDNLVFPEDNLLNENLLQMENVNQNRREQLINDLLEELNDINVNDINRRNNNR